MPAAWRRWHNACQSTGQACTGALLAAPARVGLARQHVPRPGVTEMPATGGFLAYLNVRASRAGPYPELKL